MEKNLQIVDFDKKDSTLDASGIFIGHFLKSQGCFLVVKFNSKQLSFH